MHLMKKPLTKIRGKEPEWARQDIDSEALGGLINTHVYIDHYNGHICRKSTCHMSHMSRVFP